MNHRSKQRKGVTAVEFAVTLPVAFLFVFALIEIMSLYKIRDGVQLAIFTGGRQAMIETESTADIRDKITTVLDSFGIQSANVLIEPSNLNSQTNDIRISVSVDATAENGMMFGRLYQGKIERTLDISRE